MSTATSKLYLIAGPAADRERANAFAAQLDPQGGSLTFREAFLRVAGAVEHEATHTGCFGPIADTHAPLVERTMLPQFPGWVLIQSDDPETALALARLERAPAVLPLA